MRYLIIEILTIIRNMTTNRKQEKKSLGLQKMFIASWTASLDLGFEFKLNLIYL